MPGGRGGRKPIGMIGILHSNLLPPSKQTKLGVGSRSYAQAAVAVLLCCVCSSSLGAELLAAAVLDQSIFLEKFSQPLSLGSTLASLAWRNPLLIVQLFGWYTTPQVPQHTKSYASSTDYSSAAFLALLAAVNFASFAPSNQTTCTTA